MGFILDNLNYLIWIGIFIAGLLTGILWGVTRFAKIISPEIKQVGFHHDETKKVLSARESTLLETYRRELANYLIIRDPSRYLNLFRSTQREIARLNTKEKRTNQLTVLGEKYPDFQNFDAFGAWEHNLYNPDRSIEELEHLYFDTRVFHYCLGFDDPTNDSSELFEKKQLEFVKKYSKDLKNYLFVQKLKLAYGIFCSIAETNEKLLNNNTFESSWFKMSTGDDVAGTRSFYFYFKDTKENGTVLKWSEGNSLGYLRNMDVDKSEDLEHDTDILLEDDLLFIQNPFKAYTDR